MNKDSIAWRKVLKEVTEQLATLPNNLQKVPTDFDLVKDMLDKLQESVDFSDKTFLTFNLEFIESLVYNYGVNKNNIFFVSDCKEKVSILLHERYKGVNTVEGDFLQWETNMKFDCVVMNPPYQGHKERKASAVNGTCGSEIWDKFVIKALELLKENGYLAAVHPPKWRKPGHDIFPLIHGKDLEYLEIHSLDDGMKTFKAATAYDWYVLRKSAYNGKTIIKDVNGGEPFTIDISNFDCIPSGSFELFDKLLAKKGEEKCEVIYNRTNYGHDKNWISKVKSDVYQYPCIYGLTQKSGLKFLYSSVNDKGHFGIKKVIVPLSKYTDAFIDKNGEYGLCEFAFGIKFDTLEEADGIKKAVMSDGFKKIWQATEWIANSKEWRIFKSFKKDWWKEFA